MAQIGTPSPDTGRAEGDKYQSQPLLTKKQCHMHFIVRPPKCLTDNYDISTTMRQYSVDNSQPENKLLTSFGRYRKLSVQVSWSITPVGVR